MTVVRCLTVECRCWSVRPCRPATSTSYVGSIGTRSWVSMAGPRDRHPVHPRSPLCPPAGVRCGWTHAVPPPCGASAVRCVRLAIESVPAAYHQAERQAELPPARPAELPAGGRVHALPHASGEDGGTAAGGRAPRDGQLYGHAPERQTGARRNRSGGTYRAAQSAGRCGRDPSGDHPSVWQAAASRRSASASWVSAIDSCRSAASRNARPASRASPRRRRAQPSRAR